LSGVTPTPIAGELEAGLKALRFPAQWEARFVAETGPQRVRHFIISALTYMAYKPNLRCRVDTNRNRL
jgi:hypothetical protein